MLLFANEMASKMRVDYPKEGIVGERDKACHGISDSFSLVSLILMRSDLYDWMFRQDSNAKFSHIIEMLLIIVTGSVFLLPLLIAELSRHIRVRHKIVRFFPSAP
mmetsp:Transcript_33868/g.55253  ORF Transcript_33868/g.55253 Transcript_33868/m.55253 type:complete len:105 (+) Transcript_33868:758-1072(+)